MKRWLSLILAILVCFSLVACTRGVSEESVLPTTQQQETQPTQQQAEQTAQSAPLLYRVTDENGNEIWLFGSIHVGQESFYPLPDYVQEAFESADVLAVEFDILAFEADTTAQINSLQPLIYTDGTTIKDHIPADLYDKAVAILEEGGYYNAALDYYCPAMWSSFIDTMLYENIGADSSLGIDRHLLTEAKEAQMPIESIESAASQYLMMGSFSPELQRVLLEESVNCMENMDLEKEALTNMMELWASGDEEAFVDYLYDEVDEEDPDYNLIIEYNKAMIEDRNVLMADYAEAALTSGKRVFICVGAAHVVGPGAMAELLAQRGYTVERVE